MLHHSPLQSVLAQLPVLCEGVQPSSRIAFGEETGLMEPEDSKQKKKSENIDVFSEGEEWNFVIDSILFCTRLMLECNTNLFS